MEIYYQPQDITVFGELIKDFPRGIAEAFKNLMKIFGNKRAYYGISWMDENDSIKYYAVTTETIEGEAKQYNYTTLIIKNGEYYAETLHDWPSKLECLKDIFHLLMPNNKPDKNHPCIEWYKSDDEMLCMVNKI
jgi:hypothetical protein